MKIVFTDKEFDIFRKFQDRLTKEFGETVYVGTDSATVLLNYSPEFKAMIRPCPTTKHYEFVVRQLACSGCKKKEMFICLESQTEYLCDDCVVKRKMKGVQKEVKAE